MEPNHPGQPPLPNYLVISAHAELRMIERDVLTADLLAVRRSDPLLEWQMENSEEDRAVPGRVERKMRTIRNRPATSPAAGTLEMPDEDGFSVVVTVFDASEADRRRYRRHGRRRNQR